MMHFFEKSDERLLSDVKNELEWDPSVTSTDISVTAKNGVLTLRGTVPHFSEKSKAEDAAQRVVGVRAIADELEVKILGPYERSDEDIAQAALTAMQWNYQVPEGLKVFVSKGWVTLKGNVEWDYQRTAAHDAVSMLLGVGGVTNEIAIKSKLKSSDVKTRIEEALKRSAEKEGRDIKVAVHDHKVTLSGKVHSLNDLEVAIVAAWNAPGVTNVANDLLISG